MLPFFLFSPVFPFFSSPDFFFLFFPTPGGWGHYDIGRGEFPPAPPTPPLLSPLCCTVRYKNLCYYILKRKKNLSGSAFLILRERQAAGDSGGCFAGMRAFFLMENKVKSSVYAQVVRAGGGFVIDTWSLDELLAFKPGIKN